MLKLKALLEHLEAYGWHYIVYDVVMSQILLSKWIRQENWGHLRILWWRDGAVRPPFPIYLRNLQFYAI
jgi:hypothetical protein